MLLNKYQTNYCKKFIGFNKDQMFFKLLQFIVCTKKTLETIFLIPYNLCRKIFNSKLLGLHTILLINRKKIIITK